MDIEKVIWAPTAEEVKSFELLTSALVVFNIEKYEGLVMDGRFGLSENLIFFIAGGEQRTVSQLIDEPFLIFKEEPLEIQPVDPLSEVQFAQIMKQIPYSIEEV